MFFSIWGWQCWHSEGHRCATTSSPQTSSVKVTVGFRATSLEDRDNELQRVCLCHKFGLLSKRKYTVGGLYNIIWYAYIWPCHWIHYYGKKAVHTHSPVSFISTYQGELWVQRMRAYTDMKHAFVFPMVTLCFVTLLSDCWLYFLIVCILFNLIYILHYFWIHSYTKLLYKGIFSPAGLLYWICRYARSAHGTCGDSVAKSQSIAL